MVWFCNAGPYHNVQFAWRSDTQSYALYVTCKRNLFSGKVKALTETSVQKLYLLYVIEPGHFFTQLNLELLCRCDVSPLLAVEI